MSGNVFTKAIAVTVAGAAAFALAACGTSPGAVQSPLSIEPRSAASQPAASAVPLENRLENVMAGKYDGARYVAEVSLEVPEVKALMESGIIPSVLYDLTPQQYGAKLKELLTGKVPPDTLDEWLQHYLSPTAELAKTFSFNPTAGRSFVYGLNLPVLIHIPSLFNEDLKTFIQSDADLKLLLGHEGQHARDFHFGISYKDGTTITRHNYESSQVSSDFMENLVELRGYYWELDSIFRVEVGIDSAKYSQANINLAVYKYYTHWSALALAKRNALEERVWAAQRAEMPGITPTKVDENEKQITLRVFFRLYGSNSDYMVTLPKNERQSR